MRIKDDKKKEALFLATIKLVNEIGFVSSSVSKIAKEANVSPATLYIYFKNKDDLIVSTYIEIKRSMSNAMLEDFDTTMPVRDILQQTWHKIFSYVSDNREDFRYAEQFSNSPYTDLLDKSEVQKFFEPFIHVIERGIKEKVIKDVHFEILTTFIFSPVTILANPNHCHSFSITEQNVETAFQLAWDAIKL